MNSRLDISEYPAAWAHYRRRWRATWAFPLAFFGLYLLSALLYGRPTVDLAPRSRRRRLCLALRQISELALPTLWRAYESCFSPICTRTLSPPRLLQFLMRRNLHSGASTCLPHAFADVCPPAPQNTLGRPFQLRRYCIATVKTFRFRLATNLSAIPNGAHRRHRGVQSP